MKRNLLGLAATTTLVFAFAGEALATEWNVSVWGKRRAFTENVEKIAELVSAKTNGEFTLNISYGGLSKAKENLDGISIGAFEMAQFCAGYHEDKNPSITVLELPFLGVDSLEKEVQVSQAVYSHPAVVADLARWNATLLMPTPMPQYNIVGVGDAPKSLAAFDGLTVRATGGIGAAKWWTTNLNPGTVNCPVVVNTDALAALTDKERDALLGSVDEALAFYIDYYNNQTMAKWGPLLDSKGVERITYDEATLASFREKVAGPAASAWVEANNARGLPAQELLDLVQSEIAK